MSAVIIRPAQPEDAADIAVLTVELGYDASREQMHSRLLWLQSTHGHWVGVAEQGGAPLLGWVHVAHRFTLEEGASAEILGLVIGASARRLGVGTALVDAAEHWSRQLGIATIKVRSNSARSESHLFYPALGYARTKSQHVYAKGLRTDP